MKIPLPSRRREGHPPCCGCLERTALLLVRAVGPEAAMAAIP